MYIVLGADHRGFKLKEDLKIYLEALGHEIEDVGAHHFNADDDYPDFAYPAAVIVAERPDTRGILVCGSGMGMDIVANKVKGVRATLVTSPETAQHAAARDGANMITLSADALDEDGARAIVSTFLDTPFSNNDRDIRRVEKVKALEAIE